MVNVLQAACEFCLVTILRVQVQVQVQTITLINFNVMGSLHCLLLGS